jgi:hypothetical protein
MPRRKSGLIAAVLFFLAPAGFALAAEAPLFQFEQQAKLHCPDDTVVWVNPSSGTYNFPGERWYGATRHGAYVCQREGDHVGYRPSRNPDQAREGFDIKRWFTGG